MGAADLSVKMVLIVIVGVFLGSFMDAIAGGGGIITVPTYLLAGLPAHFALGTNKFSAAIGTFFSTGRFIKNKYVDWVLGVPSIVLAVIGSHFGTRLQLMVDEKYLKYLLLIVLPVVAFVVLRQRKFPEEPGEIERKKQMAIVWVSSLVVGAYDGFYGPGTGTFLILLYTALARMDVLTAGGNTKLSNLASNVMSITVFLFNGTVLIPLGLTAAVFSIAGHFIGAGIALKKGAKSIRFVILIVIALLFAKVIFEMLTK